MHRSDIIIIFDVIYIYIYNLFICLLNSMLFFFCNILQSNLHKLYIQFNVHVYISGSYSTTLHVCLTAQCKPGEYSVSGLVPCSPCPRSSYQPQSMSSTCLACPTGKSSKSGSTMLSECKGKNQKICFDTTFFGLKIYG